MLSSFMVVVLIYQSIVCVHVKFIPFVCPAKCKCRAKQILSCSIDSLKEFSVVGRTAEIEELQVKTCDGRDFDRLSTETLYPVMQLRCEKLLLKNNREQHSYCVYSPRNIPKNNCVNICRKTSTNLIPSTVKCLCFNCHDNINQHRTDPSVRIRRGAVVPTTNATTTANPKAESRNFFIIVVVAGISVAAFLFNFVVMVKLCCSPLTVIDLFGTALMMFNVLLSIYGMSMAFYLFRSEIRQYESYCQFFTSIKLFALGAGVYTLTLLVFHHPIRRSVDDNLERGGEKEEKESELKKRDAIFKGIVFILEGVMLSGVLGVLSWIKFKDWGYLCAIIDPQGSVEDVLFGIEMWYYVLTGLLIGWYFGNWAYRQYIIINAFKENLRRKKNGEEEEEVKRVTPYIIRDFPIFLMVLISFVLWIGGHIIIQPKYNLFTDKNMAAVTRVCSVLLPLIVQPFIYIIRKCCLSRKDRANTCDDMKLECKCSGECNCNNCDMDELSQSKNNNTQVTKFGSSRSTSKGILDDDEHLSSDDEDDDHHGDSETTALQKNTNKRNNFDIPKVVCRSPVSGNYQEKSDESTRLLDDMDGKKPSTPTPNTPTIIIEDEMIPDTAERKDLAIIDESEEGRVSRGPTFYPIAKKETETLPGRIELKNDSSADVKINNEANENANIELNNNISLGKQKEKDLDKQNSRTSLENSLSDSSVSQESASRVEEQLTDSNSPTHSINKEHREIIDTDPTECELKKTIDINSELNVHLNNDCDKDASDEKEALLNSSTSSSSPTSEEVSSDTNLNNTHDSNHRDVFNKVASHPSDGDVNSNHTNNKIRRSLVDDVETIER